MIVSQSTPSSRAAPRPVPGRKAGGRLFMRARRAAGHIASRMSRSAVRSTPDARPTGDAGWFIWLFGVAFFLLVHMSDRIIAGLTMAGIIAW